MVYEKNLYFLIVICWILYIFPPVFYFLILWLKSSILLNVLFLFFCSFEISVINNFLRFPNIMLDLFISLCIFNLFLCYEFWCYILLGEFKSRIVISSRWVKPTIIMFSFPNNDFCHLSYFQPFFILLLKPWNFKKCNLQGLPWWSSFHCGGWGFDPWLGNKDPTYLEVWPSPQEKNCNMFFEWWV